jgi:peptidoglycan/xylan/chitin deacetylase (PgdA/CDA1 family)
LKKLTIFTLSLLISLPLFSLEKNVTSSNILNQEHFERLIRIFAKSENYLMNFDKELEQNANTNNTFSLGNSDSYRKLLVMRFVKEDLELKILSAYKALLTASHTSTDPQKRKQAKLQLRQIHQYLRNSTPAQQLAFEDIREALYDVLIDYKKHRNDVDQELKDSSVSSFKNDEERIKALKNFRSTLNSDKTNNAIVQPMDQFDKKIQKEEEKLLPTISFDEYEQNYLFGNVFTPSTGPNGNVVGLIFPKNVWALTYDDGPHPTHTHNILNNLDQLKIKASFFWLAQNVIIYKSTVADVKAKNHSINDHSWSHAQLPKLNDGDLYKEVVQSKKAEEQVYGETINFFRCPYGAGNSVPRIRKLISDQNMIHVFWSVDSLDWQDKDPDSIVARVQKQMNANGHGVILFHDIHPQSVIASKRIVEATQKLSGPSAARWVTIPEIVAEMNDKAEGK